MLTSTEEAAVADNTVPDNIVERKTTTVQPTEQPELPEDVELRISSANANNASPPPSIKMEVSELNNSITSTLLPVAEKPVTTTTTTTSTSTTTTQKPTTTTTTTTTPKPTTTTTTTTQKPTTTTTPSTTTFRSLSIVTSTPKPRNDPLETNLKLLQQYLEANQVRLTSAFIQHDANARLTISEGHHRYESRDANDDGSSQHHVQKYNNFDDDDNHPEAHNNLNNNVADNDNDKASSKHNGQAKQAQQRQPL